MGKSTARLLASAVGQLPRLARLFARLGYPPPTASVGNSSRASTNVSQRHIMLVLFHNHEFVLVALVNVSRTLKLP